MNGPTAPAAPDPYKTAAAQTGTNITSGVAQQQLNQTNQVTPYGNLTYTQTGMQTVTDPATGKTYQIPQSTATQTLSPEQQQLYDQSTGLQSGMNNLAQGQVDKLTGLLGTNVDLSPEAINAQSNSMWHAGLDPIWAERQRQNEDALSAKGFRQGDTGYTQGVNDFNASRDQAYNVALNQNQGLAMQQILAQRNQPISEISQLLHGPQAATYANSPQAGISSANLEGDVYNSYQAKQNAYNQQLAQQNAMWGTLGNLGGTALSAGWMLSDPRAKTDKRKIADLRPSVGLYKFRYKNSPFQQLGVMANEIEKAIPDAVRTRPDGLREVNYDRVAEEL